MNGTQAAAFAGIAPHIPAMRQRIYKFVESRGAQGATRDEIETSLGMLHQTVSPRLRELEQDGCVIDSGAVRPTKSNFDAVVWVIKGPYSKGDRAAQHLKPKQADIEEALFEIHAQFGEVCMPDTVRNLLVWIDKRFVK